MCQTGCKTKQLNLHITGMIPTRKPWHSVERQLTCVLFKAYTGERAWKAIGNRLQWPSYLSRVEH
jgi:hypothetical protein